MSRASEIDAKVDAVVTKLAQQSLGDILVTALIADRVRKCYVGYANQCLSV